MWRATTRPVKYQERRATHRDTQRVPCGPVFRNSRTPSAPTSPLPEKAFPLQNRVLKTATGLAIRTLRQGTDRTAICLHICFNQQTSPATYCSGFLPLRPDNFRRARAGLVGISHSHSTAPRSAVAPEGLIDPCILTRGRSIMTTPWATSTKPRKTVGYRSGWPPLPRGARDLTAIRQIPRRPCPPRGRREP